jgi:hypothetical protein
VNVPQEYNGWFASLPFHEVSFGYAELKLYSPAEMDEVQIGYARSVEGESLADGQPGSWKPEWIVIGNDELLGDPLILDTTNADYPVMTASHGEGSWDARVIASSLDAFAFALKTIRQLSAGRENPAKLEQRPLPEQERERALQAIRASNRGEIDLEFWSLILESGLP